MEQATFGVASIKMATKHSEEGCGVDIYPNQSSGVLSSVAWGNVLVRQKSGENIRVNDTVDVLIY